MYRYISTRFASANLQRLSFSFSPLFSSVFLPLPLFYYSLSPSGRRSLLVFLLLLLFPRFHPILFLAVRELSWDTSKVAGTGVRELHTRLHYRFTLGCACETNAHTTAPVTPVYGMCLEGTVVANYFVSPASGWQLQFDSPACKEILPISSQIDAPVFRLAVAQPTLIKRIYNNT